MQEVAGKGLALVYQAAGSESKQGLVDSLVDALSTGRRRAAASGAATGTAPATGGVDVHGPTHAGAALSEAGAGAYGEMCAVSTSSCSLFSLSLSRGFFGRVLKSNRGFVLLESFDLFSCCEPHSAWLRTCFGSGKCTAENACLKAGIDVI